MNTRFDDLPITFWKEITNFKFWLESIKVFASFAEK